MDIQIPEKQERLNTDSYSHSNGDTNTGNITEGLHKQGKYTTYIGKEASVQRCTIG